MLPAVRSRLATGYASAKENTGTIFTGMVYMVVAILIITFSVMTLHSLLRKAKSAKEYYEKAKEIADANKGGSGGPTEYELMEDARQLIAIIAGRVEYDKTEGTTLVIRPKNAEDAKDLVSEGYADIRTICWMSIVFAIILALVGIILVAVRKRAA